MGYEAAIEKAWAETARLSDKDKITVRLLDDNYEIRIKDKNIMSLALRARTKDFLSILLLHYITGKLKNVLSPDRQWISFKEIEGGDFYYPAFHEGAIKPVIKKFGADPQKLLDALDRFSGSRIDAGDAAIEISAFDDVNLRIIVWKGDEELPAEATMLFDRNLSRIYTSEDIAVFLRFVAHKL